MDAIVNETDTEATQILLQYNGSIISQANVEYNNKHRTRFLCYTIKILYFGKQTPEAESCKILCVT